MAKAQHTQKKDKSVRFSIDGMHCSNCAINIEKQYRKHPGVVDVAVNLANNTGKVTYDPSVTNEDDLLHVFDALSFTAEKIADDTPFVDVRRRKHDAVRAKQDLRVFLISLVFTVLIFGIGMLPGVHMALGNAVASLFVPDPTHIQAMFATNLILLVLTIPVQFGCGARFYVGAWNALRTKSANMDVLVGLEIKYEMTVGELTNIRQAALPILGAVGGVLMPILIYVLCNISNPNTIHGWGVPTATDIAFALGILALLGNKVPNGVKIFLSTLAVADDIIAILVIAIFYGEAPNLMWLGAACAILIILFILNRTHMYALTPYLIMGSILWFTVFMSGIHSTIAGVLLAIAIPSGSSINIKNFLRWSDERIQLADTYHDETAPLIAQKKYIRTVSNLSNVSRKAVPPAVRLEEGIYPWVYFLILPLFALTNADVSLQGIGLQDLASSTVVAGVFFGLVLGKPIGIMAMSFLCVKLGIGKLPEGVNWVHMLGAAILGGVGFTMAIFVANLAYEQAVLVTEAKFAILLASLIAGIIGFALLFIQASRTKNHTQ